MKRNAKRRKDRHLTSLRNKIVLYFLACSVLTSVANTLLDMIFEILFKSNLYGIINEATEEEQLIGVLPVVIPYIILSIAVYVVGIHMFIRLTIRALDQESTRRVKEQNLMYAAIAHDLKTPMTSVLGFAKALQDGKVKPEEEKEIYGIIYDKTAAMNSLADTLFEYAELGTEEYRPVLEKTGLCSLVRDCAAVSYSDLEERGDRPEIDIPDGELYITADRKELKRAVTNLILNACRHNPGGTGILIRVAEENGRAKVVIADTGSDIPDGMTIFEPFVTENSARTAGAGTGLGLAITKRIAERHGGSVSVEHNIEGYTKAFVMVIPLRTN